LSCESGNKAGEFLVFLVFGVFLNLSNDPSNFFAEKTNYTIRNILLLLQATGDENETLLDVVNLYEEVADF
jgi:hypothetical protein